MGFAEVWCAVEQGRQKDDVDRILYLLDFERRLGGECKPGMSHKMSDSVVGIRQRKKLKELEKIAEALIVAVRSEMPDDVIRHISAELVQCEAAIWESLSEEENE